MLALPEGQTDEAWEPAKRNALSEIGQHRIEKFFQYSSHLVMDTAPGPIPHIWLWTLLLALPVHRPLVAAVPVINFNHFY